MKRNLQASPSVLSGRLLRSIMTRFSGNRAKGESSVKVGPRGVPYAHLVELGHRVRGKKGSGKIFGKKKNRTENPSGKRVEAEPYVGPAYLSNRDNLHKIIGDALRVGIAEALKKK